MMYHMNLNKRIFIGFAAEDRYDIVEPIVYHLKNYGIELWYDRHMLVMSDNRVEKNLIEGAAGCDYAVIILSKHTAESNCALEEMSIVESRFNQGKVTVFPVLYELSPNELPEKLCWVKSLVFKEVDRHSGTREICNHIACKVTDDLLDNCHYRHIQDIVYSTPEELPLDCRAILKSYLAVDYANLNSRVSLLYAAYLTVILRKDNTDWVPPMVTRIFERLFSETRLSLSIDYREIWLLENAVCLLINEYVTSCTESKI